MGLIQRPLHYFALILVMNLHPVVGQAQGDAELTTSFTASQASAGARSYSQYCAACHGANLEGEAIAPSLTGERFALQWARQFGGAVAGTFTSNATATGRRSWQPFGRNLRQPLCAPLELKRCGSGRSSLTIGPSSAG